MRNKELSFTLPEDKAKKLLESQQQLIMINDEKGEWTGRTVNKADIMMTRVDVEETRRRSEKEKSLLEIDSKVIYNLTKEQVKALLENFKPDFLKK